MSGAFDLSSARAERDAAQRRLANLVDPSFLASGTGGPHDPGMEAKVAKLGADVGEIKTTLARLEPLLKSLDEGNRKIQQDVAELKGRVSQLPGTLQLLGFVLVVLALAGVTRIFGH